MYLIPQITLLDFNSYEDFRAAGKVLNEKFESLLDPMQFAYRASRVVNATTAVFYDLYKHVQVIK